MAKCESNLLSSCREVIASWQILERKWKDGQKETQYVKGVRHGFKNAAKMLQDAIAESEAAQ